MTVYSDGVNQASSVSYADSGRGLDVPSPGIDRASTREDRRLLSLLVLLPC